MSRSVPSATSLSSGLTRSLLLGSLAAILLAARLQAEERLLIREIRVRGNRAISAERILAASGLRRGKPLLEADLEAARKAALEGYRREGFLLATVSAAAEPAFPGRADVSLLVSEGPRVHLKEVSFDGVSGIPRSEALRALGIRPRRLFGIISPGYYVPEDLEAALSRLKDHYRSLGYLSAVAGFGGLELDRSLRKATLRILVREGPRYKIAEARVEGSRLFPREDLERAAGIRSGEFYSRDEVERALDRLREFYAARSDRLPAIAARTEYREDDAVAVVLDIREERFVETGTVSISGNRFTRDRVIRSRVGLVPGEPFSPNEVERTLERIRSLGYFRKAEIELEERREPESPEKVFTDVHISVEEPERLGSLIEVGGGASSGSGEVFYVGMRRANFDLFRLPKSWDDWRGAFRGGGQYLELKFLPGTKESQYSFRFEEPYFFRSDFSLSLASGIGIYERERHRESHLGGSIHLRKFLDFERRWSIGAAWFGERVRVDELEPAAPADAYRVEGDTLLSYPRLEARYDGLERNFYSGPKGFFARAYADLASAGTGSEVSFVRAVVSADWFLGIYEPEPDHRHLLRLSARGMWIRGLGGDDVPLFERFYLGGPRSFRGFEYRGLGPREAGAPVGGEAGLAGTVEYSFPIVRRELRGFLVFDWGDLEPRISEIRLGRFRTAAGGGIGLRLKALGQYIPATFYWVCDLTRERGDRTRLFSFAIGTDF